jgi:hypothetical protein
MMEARQYSNANANASANATQPWRWSDPACEPSASVRDGEHEPSLGRLLKNLTSESRTLLRKEIELAKTEMMEKAARIGRNLGYLALGGLIAFAAFLTLLGAASYGLMEALDERIPSSVAIWLAPLLVGVAVAIAAGVLISKALATLRNEDLTPHKTKETLQENKQWLLNRTTRT